MVVGGIHVFARFIGDPEDQRDASASRCVSASHAVGSGVAEGVCGSDGGAHQVGVRLSSPLPKFSASNTV